MNIGTPLKNLRKDRILNMTYVMSDIHGNKKRFESVLSQINLKSTDRLYILGDVIDRFPYGIELLQRIRQMKNARLLLGNHEYMMLQALSGHYDKTYIRPDRAYIDEFRLWRMNWSGRTIQGFKHLPNTEKDEILKYLRTRKLSLRITVNGRRYLLVHAAPSYCFTPADKEDYGFLKEFMVWARIDPKHPLHADETLVFGHTPTSGFQEGSPLRIWYGENRIGIDCGAGWDNESSRKLGRGRLACLRLDDMKEFYSEE